MRKQERKERQNHRLIPDKAFTHGGIFHADDVFSTALLRLLNPQIKIERGNIVPEHYDGIIFDIGGGEFDHHQEDNEKRENGIPYAAFGKLWRQFGRELIAEKYVQEFDEIFIQKIDLADNSDIVDSMSEAICSFRPLWDEEKSMEVCFWEAVAFAKEILFRQFKKYKSKCYAEEAILEKLNDVYYGILVLDKYIPYGKLLIDKDVNFVIFPSLRGGYTINNIEGANGSKKVNFLPEWLGSCDESIGLTFCHKGNFTATADTLEHAIEVARIATEKNINI